MVQICQNSKNANELFDTSKSAEKIKNLMNRKGKVLFYQGMKRT
jgi:hypothetical protein